MKLLIAGSNSRFFHLNAFGKALQKLGVEYKLIHDIEFISRFFDLNVQKRIRRKKNLAMLLNEFKSDVVLLDRLSYLAIPILKEKIPLFLFLRGNYWKEAELIRNNLSKQKYLSYFKNQKIANKCFNEAKIIIPISHYLENVVKGHYPNKIIKMLYADGRNLADWYPQKGMNLKHPCVGLLQGANIWEKTKEMLTLTKVLEAMPDVMFYWAGDGPYRDQVLPALEKYDNFKWLGSLQYPNKVREFLTEIDVYALVSGLEGLGQTIIEASLMKKPVIATNVGGVPELIDDGKTGFLVEKGDHDGWVKKLNILITDSEKAKEMSYKNYSFINENFSWETIARKFIEIIKPYSKGK